MSQEGGFPISDFLQHVNSWVGVAKNVITPELGYCPFLVSNETHPEDLEIYAVRIPSSLLKSVFREAPSEQIAR